jgi:MFS family permease
MTHPSTGDEPSASSYGGPAYSWYVVVLLAAVYACHSMDRGMAGILVEPLRHEFKLNDKQLGLFTGLAFGLSFSLAVLPMGYVADRVNRKNLLALIVLLWSGMTALGGLTRNFAQLVAMRLGVGASEAGAAPLALPMLSDIFPADKRAFALGVFYTSSPIGGFLAAIIGATVAANYGWRAALVVAGLPGILLAVLLFLTVREPKRGGSDGAVMAEKPPGMLASFRFLFKAPAIFCLMCACALMGLLNITIGVWTMSFFMRVHEVPLAQASLILGIGGGLIGMMSPPAMGWLADKLTRRNVRWPLRLVVLAALGSFALTLVMLFTPSLIVAIATFVVADFLRHGYTPPTYSVLMTSTPASMRGGVMSILQLMTNLVGFGLGPFITGALSDYYGGGTAIRYALANAAFVFLLVVALLLLASRLIYGPRKAAPQPQPPVRASSEIA